MSDKRLRKIKYLLNLANDANDEESKTALAKAQELMMSYNISENELFDYTQKQKAEAVITQIIYSGRPHKWLYRLARIIARNFRVKYYYTSGNPIELKFTGLASDVQIAEVVFQYARGSILYNVGCYMKQPEIKRKYKRKWQLKQDYIEGYLVGLAVALEQSVIANGYELALQLPEIVKIEVKKLELTTSKDVSHTVENPEAYFEGRQEGLKFKDKEQIEAA